jgi:uncharacterized protein with PQ loop repeat
VDAPEVDREAVRTVELGITLAYLGATLGVCMVVPQILRTVRHPTLGGVSPLTWSLTALACTAWMTYGLRTATWPQVPGNVLLVSGAVAIVVLVPSPASRGRRGVRLALATALLVTTAALLPPHAVGYLAFSLGLVSAWPQVYDSVSTWRSGETSGVSVTTWLLKIVSQLCWLSYALTARDFPVTISALVALSTACSLVILETSGPWLRRATVEAA